MATVKSVDRRGRLSIDLRQASAPVNGLAAPVDAQASAPVNGSAAPGPIARWILAARPRTLPLAAAPVFVGCALAAADGRARALPAAAAFAGALLLQLGANFANDLFDAERGADTEARIGPARATQRGWIAPREMRRAIGAAFGAAVAVGLYLVWTGGWPIALVGALGVAAGLAYSGGPWPLGYHGLGDAAVFLFFGVIAVGGTYWVQAGTLPPTVLAASLPAAALATAVLAVNNVRDVDTDREAGKRTLVVRLGVRAGHVEYAALLALAFGVPVALWAAGAGSAALLLPCLALVPALRLLRTVATRRDGPALNEALAGTAKLALAHAVLFGLGWLA